MTKCVHERPAAVADGQYGNWVAPKEDGALLIWPEAATLADLARRNSRRLAGANEVRIGGVSLPELRRAARAFVGHAGDEPLIATGHQSELHHPGVWIKIGVIAATAEAAGGAAVHIAVDTDSPKHLKLAWPGFSAPLTDDPRLHSAAWSGLLDPPTPEHVNSLIKAAGSARARGLVSPLLEEFLSSCRAYLLDQRDAVAPLDLPGMLANAQHALDWELGLRYTELMLSGMLASEPWLTFVYGIAANAERFAAAYNAALAEHRRETGNSDPERPMPDLANDTSRIELPFWLDDQRHGRRARATFSRSARGVELYSPADGDAFAFNADAEAAPLLLRDWLRRHDLRIAPRALSLTVFLRLLVCDLFVHGIGGGHYDRVTDRLIRDYFGIEPPGFAVATATLYHPQAAGRQRVCLPCLKQEGHQLEHAVLGEQKRRWLDEISAAQGFHSRRKVFEAMHEARRKALADDLGLREWQRRITDTQGQLEQEVEIFNREVFYAIQSAERLNGLINRVRAELAH